MTTTEIETKAAEVGHSISGLLILAGINRATWWRWKTGKFQPRAASIKRILYVINELHRP
jgi:predicted transcriptional regulator